MGKCVLEKPRRGHRNRGFKSRKFGVLVDRGDGLEYEGPTKIWSSMNYGQRVCVGKKASWGASWGEKSFSDCLGPINGYLFSKIGQPWNNVHSEICQVLGRNAPWPIQHILHAHIDVEQNCFEHEGKIHYNTSKYWWRNAGTVSGLYVHPRTGILCYEPEGDWHGRGPGKRKRPKRQKPIEEIRNGDGGWSYVRIGGLWFKGIYKKAEYEVWNKYHKRLETVSHDVFTSKRSCNRKDLRWLRAQPGVQ